MYKARITIILALLFIFLLDHTLFKPCALICCNQPTPLSKKNTDYNVWVVFVNAQTLPLFFLVHGVLITIAISLSLQISCVISLFVCCGEG